MKKKNNTAAFVLILFMILSGCGGGGGGDGEDTGTNTGTNANQTVIQTGVFRNRAVRGLRYMTSPGGLTGITDENGGYQYVEGDIVCFFLGDTIFGTCDAGEVLTPLNLVEGATDETNISAANICRLLESIDFNNDPDDGIEITDTMLQAFVGLSLDFSLPDAEFEAAVAGLFANLNALIPEFGGTRSLMSLAQAQANFRQTLLYKYAGTYKGTFTGDHSSGDWSLTADIDGILEGTADDGYGELIPLEGELSPVGQADFTATGGGWEGAQFTATIDESGKVSGTFEYPEDDEEGTLTGSLKTKADDPWVIDNAHSDDHGGPNEDLDGDGYTPAQGDFNDLEPTIHPKAAEICDDGIDQNCDLADPPCDCQVTCAVENDCSGMSWGITCELGGAYYKEDCEVTYVGDSSISVCTGTITYDDTGNTYNYTVTYNWPNCSIDIEVDGVGSCSDF